MRSIIVGKLGGERREGTGGWVERREVHLMNLVRVCTSSMSPVVDVNDLVIRDWNEKAIGIPLHLSDCRLMKDILPTSACCTTTPPLRRLNFWSGFQTKLGKLLRVTLWQGRQSKGQPTQSKVNKAAPTFQMVQLRIHLLRKVNYFEVNVCWSALARLILFQVHLA